MTEWTKRDRKVSPQVLYRVLVLVWVLITLALAIWWLIHGLQQVRTLSELDPLLGQKFSGQHRMILGEGLTLISLLIIGGASFFALLLRESRRNEQMKAFFATFTHELKTPLASLRLQAEALQEDFEEHAQPETNASSGRLVARLLHDASRLELQLDNALFLATARMSDQIHLEPVAIASVLERLRSTFPDFDLKFAGDVLVQADRRALESVVKNLVQNARIHGRATRMEVLPRASAGVVHLRFVDNGEGFRGQADALGKLFYRHTSQSGSGIGLHLCRVLLSRMGGDLRIEAGAVGFAVEVTLPESSGA